MTSSDEGEIIGSFLKFVISGNEGVKYALEQLRIAMGVDTREEAIERAFRELLEAYGFAFSEKSGDKQILNEEKRKLKNSHSINRAGGKIEVSLLEPLDPQWLLKIKGKTGLNTSTEIIRLALVTADGKYLPS